MRLAFSAATAMSGLVLLGLAVYGQPAEYLHEAREQWNELLNAAPDSRTVPTYNQSETITQQMSQLQQEVMALKSELSERPPAPAATTPTQPASTEPQMGAVTSDMQPAPADMPGPKAPTPPVTASDAQLQTQTEAPVPATVPPVATTPRPIVAQPAAPASPPAVAQPVTPPAPPPAVAQPVTPAPSLAAAPPPAALAQPVVPSPPPVAMQPGAAPPTATALAPAVMPTPSLGEHGTARRLSESQGTEDRRASPAVRSEPGRAARPTIVVPDRREFADAVPGRPARMTSGSHGAIVPPPPRTAEAPEASAARPAVPDYAPPPVRADSDDTQSVLARLRQTGPSQPPASLQAPQAPPPSPPPAAALQTLPRLNAAGAALAAGRVDDAVRLLQEAQLQLVFRPVDAQGGNQEASRAGASDVARALEALSANNIPSSQRYINRAKGDLTGQETGSASNYSDIQPSGYAPAYPPR